MAAILLGAHMPTAGGLGGAIRNGKAIGCTAVQVFTSSPQQWRAKPVTEAMVADFRAAQAETGIDVVVSHDSYLVNLCALEPEKREQSIAGLKAD
jgi:deoxyribonuclease-4